MGFWGFGILGFWGFGGFGVLGFWGFGLEHFGRLSLRVGLLTGSSIGAKRAGGGGGLAVKMKMAWGGLTLKLGFQNIPLHAEAS